VAKTNTEKILLGTFISQAPNSHVTIPLLKLICKSSDLLVTIYSTTTKMARLFGSNFSTHRNYLWPRSNYLCALRTWLSSCSHSLVWSNSSAAHYITLIRILVLIFKDPPGLPCPPFSPLPLICLRFPHQKQHFSKPMLPRSLLLNGRRRGHRLCEISLCGWLRSARLTNRG